MRFLEERLRTYSLLTGFFLFSFSRATLLPRATAGPFNANTDFYARRECLRRSAAAIFSFFSLHACVDNRSASGLMGNWQ